MNILSHFKEVVNSSECPLLENPLCVRRMYIHHTNRVVFKLFSPMSTLLTGRSSNTSSGCMETVESRAKRKIVDYTVVPR